jgi:hypothetical protein
MDQNTLLVVGILALVLVAAILAFPRLKTALKGGGVEFSLEGERDAPAQPKAESGKPDEAAVPGKANAGPAISVGRDLKGSVAYGRGSIAAGGNVKIGHGSQDSDD